jgi:ribonucleotide monophosphatase NagD (HAD superfamily)
MEALLSLPDRYIYFGIGDNPLSDIKGANNAGPHWQSILVRTGMFSNVELTNDATNPADAVCDDIGAAVEYILKYTHD